MFMKGMQCPEVKPKAMMNLALVLQKKAEKMAAGGDLESAKGFAIKAGDLLDTAKPLFDNLIQSGSGGDDDQMYANQFGPLRVQTYRIMGSVYVSRKGSGDHITSATCSMYHPKLIFFLSYYIGWNERFPIM